MFNWRSHPDEGQLLRFCEGELPAREASRIDDHIRGCWECRTHIDDVRRIISDYVHYRSDVLRPSMPPPPAPWRSLSREFQRIRNEEPSPRRFNVFRRPLAWIPTGLAAIAAATATVLLIKPDTRPAPPRAEIHEHKPADSFGYRAPQPSLKGSIPPLRHAAISEEQVGPDDELRVIAALHRIGADLGDPVTVTRQREKIIISGAGLEPERVAQLRASVATIPHVSLNFEEPGDFAVPQAPAPNISPQAFGSVAGAPPAPVPPQVVESRRSLPVQSEIARQFPDHATFQAFVDQTLEASERILARAHALRSLADHFPPNVELQMKASGIALLSSIRNEHVTALANSVEGIDRSVMPVLRFLHADADSHPSPPSANWQASTGPLLSGAEQMDRLIGTMLATTTGTSLDGFSASMLAAQLAGALSDMKAGIASLERLSADDQTRSGR
jgi:hypothetical protein